MQPSVCRTVYMLGSKMESKHVHAEWLSSAQIVGQRVPLSQAYFNRYVK
jgi:hypothetical protein